ncbi:MAG TPA: hypothetical protein VGO57_14265, partial [Verrucomicrobiae bacterium]
WATPATLATIASYGGAAVAAPGLIALANGLTLSTLGFSEGGFTGSGASSEVAGVVHRGEYVFSAPAVQRIGLGNLEAMHNGGNGTTGGGSAGGGRGTKVVTVFGRDDLKREMAKPDYGEIIVHHVMKNKTRLGLTT